MLPGDASALSEARFRESVKSGEVLCARSIEPLEGSRPWLRRTWALWRLNEGKQRCRALPRLCRGARQVTAGTGCCERAFRRTKGPRSQENGRGVVRGPERTATDVTRVREWRDGVPAEAASRKTRGAELEGVYGRRIGEFWRRGTTAKGRRGSRSWRRKFLRARNGLPERETERWLQLRS